MEVALQEKCVTRLQQQQKSPVQNVRSDVSLDFWDHKQIVNIFDKQYGIFPYQVYTIYM